MPTFHNLGQLICRDRDLSKIAIIDVGADGQATEISYATLDSMANGVARSIERLGFERGDRIAILSTNCAEYLAAYFGIMRAGLVAVPVNVRFPPKMIDFVVRDAGAKLVFCDYERRAHCPPGIPIVCFGDPGAGGFNQFLNPGSFNAVLPTANETAMFLYTSGSSGVPKGVVLSHQSHIWVVETRLTERDLSRHRYLIAAPLYHMNALSLAKLAIAGYSTIVLLPSFTARDYIEAISHHRCTWLTGVPPMFAIMLREVELLAATDLICVELVRLGSAPVRHGLMSLLNRILPQAVVTNSFGTTEGGPVVFGPHPDGLPVPELSVGCPHPKVQLRLVAGDDKNAEQGVLEMKCPAIMLDYHNPGDVERMLERHADVSQAAVVPIDDEMKGQKPVAFIVPRTGRHPSEDEIKDFALANGPAYQHPRFVWFVDQLPLASTNKIDRGALRRLAEQRVTNK